MYTEEFYFFRKSVLEPDIFELWVYRLATSYHSSPRSKIKTKAESHREYLDTKVPKYRELHAFFDRVEKISRESSVKTIADHVHELIKDFDPKIKNPK
jgi:hypothetical protein